MIRRCLSALAGALLPALPTAALAHDPRNDRPRRSEFTTGTSVPLAMSPNVGYAGGLPETQGISGEWARTGSYFYMSSLDGISVLDTSDAVARRGWSARWLNLVFENEAMTYGERRNPDGLSEEDGGLLDVLP